MRVLVQRVLEASVSVDGSTVAAMRVALVNDGPVTLWIDSRER